jgi:hypothetical protein
LEEIFIAAPIQLGMSKKRNGESSEIQKRLQGKNALAAEFSAGPPVVFLN